MDLTYGLEVEGKTKRAKWVTLLNVVTTKDGLVVKEKDKLTAIGTFHPGGNGMGQDLTS